MKIKEISISGFRNIDRLRLEFKDLYNLIYGENASGKTSILEAIYYCAFGKSFRGRDLDLVKKGNEFCRVEAVFEKNSNIQKIEYAVSSEKGKWFKIDGKNVRTTAEIIQNINVVLFSPDDLSIVKDGPAVRRSFLNKEISGISKLYYSDLVKYSNIVKQRNALLKRRAGNIDIEIWNESMSESASGIVNKRLKFMKTLNEISQRIHFDISDGREKLEIRYKSSYLKNTGNEDIEREEIKIRILNSLVKNLEKDRIKGFCCTGPHADDFDILINGMNAKTHASQGQQRTAALSLKLAEVELVKYETGEFPVVLLDDILSELDFKRRSQLERIFEKAQIILTNTENTGNGNKIKVKEGNIERDERD